MSPKHQVARLNTRSHRLIASRYPTVGVFDDIADNEDDLRAAFLLEAMTNDRMTTLVRRITLFGPGDILSGPTASLVMAAFLHADEAGGRFTDRRLGAWYAALELDTALAETIYHAERRLRLSDEGFPNVIEMRELIASSDVSLVDIRGLKETRPDLYDPDDYTASQAFGVSLRWPSRVKRNLHADDGGEQEWQGAKGIIYDSVRRAGGTCLCLFRPSAVNLPVVQGDHFRYSWSASGELTVARIRTVEVAVSS